MVKSVPQITKTRTKKTKTKKKQKNGERREMYEKDDNIGNFIYYFDSYVQGKKTKLWYEN